MKTGIGPPWPASASKLAFRSASECIVTSGCLLEVNLNVPGALMSQQPQVRSVCDRCVWGGTALHTPATLPDGTGAGARPTATAAGAAAGRATRTGPLNSSLLHSTREPTRAPAYLLGAVRVPKRRPLQLDEQRPRVFGGLRPSSPQPMKKERVFWSPCLFTIGRTFQQLFAFKLRRSPEEPCSVATCAASRPRGPSWLRIDADTYFVRST